MDQAASAAVAAAGQAAPGIRIRNIMVIVDPTCHEQPALAKAVQIAGRCDGHLELFACDVRQDVPESWAGRSRMDEFRELTRLRLLSDLKALAGPLRAQGLHVSTVCEWSAAPELGIAQHAIRASADLIVKETHHHGSHPHATITHTDWDLIRQLPAPLLLVRAAEWTSSPRVLAAVEPAHPADRPVALDQWIVDHGRALADTLGGSLSVCHVLQSPPDLLDDRLTHRFAEVAVPQGLLRLVHEFKPDVLVVGAVGRPPGAQAAPVETVAQILERLDADLLVVPQGFAAFR